MAEEKQHRRKSTRLQTWDYSWPWWYYVTICTHGHECIFGNVVGGTMTLNNIGEIVREEWMKTPSIRPEVGLDDFVIMPNHVHGIIIITESVGATGSVAREGKTNHCEAAVSSIAQKEVRTAQPRATQRVAPTKGLVAGSLGAIIGQFKSKTARRINALRETRGAPVWQRNYHDHIIRNEVDLFRIRTYIANNPMQWGLDDENRDNALR